MDGGRIIGEGADGCVLSEPMWPCAAGTKIGPKIPPKPDNPNYVSKILNINDDESKFIKAAERILGPVLSPIHITSLGGECSPANSTHLPSKEDYPAFQKGLISLIFWEKDTQACGELKARIKKKESITNSKKLIYISRYPITLMDWFKDNNSKTVAVPTIINKILQEIPSFISVLQRFYQGPVEQLIHTDLHLGNIFLRPQGESIQLGISDFGRCFLRRRSEGIRPFVKFLTNDIQEYTLYSGFVQIPLEVRILNYCCQHMETSHLSPEKLIDSWLKKLPQSKGSEIITLSTRWFISFLLTKPLFIEMIETLQSIAIKIDPESTAMKMNNTSEEDVLDLATDYITTIITEKEATVLEYILSTYMSISPINSILQGLIVLLSPDLYDQAKNTLISHLSPNYTGIEIIVEYLFRMITGPYVQEGSSLSMALKAMQSVDLVNVWDDIPKA